MEQQSQSDNSEREWAISDLSDKGTLEFRSLRSLLDRNGRSRTFQSRLAKPLALLKRAENALSLSRFVFKPLTIEQGCY